MNSSRALMLGMFGPALTAVGVVWDFLDTLAARETGLEGIFSAPANFLITTGIVAALAGVPLAIRLAAHPSDAARIHARLAAIKQEVRVPR